MQRLTAAQDMAGIGARMVAKEYQRVRHDGKIVLILA
jgi:hypothetical protein